jgi:hypothetical protein
VIAGIVILALATVGRSAENEAASPQPSAGSPGGKGTQKQTNKVDFLFVQSAEGVTFENGKTMTLVHVNPQTVCFADRPERIAGHMPTSRTVPMWGEGKDSFLANPPNATLSVMNGDSISNVVVELRNPRINGTDLTYDVRFLEGAAPAQSGACSLFIDIIGMPLTPFSYAGAARRAARRGYVYGGVYGPAVVPPPYRYGYPYPPPVAY